MYPYCCMCFKVKCPPDYRSWLQTMYILFETKWAKIHTGPMLTYAPVMQKDVAFEGTAGVNTLHLTKV